MYRSPLNELRSKLCRLNWWPLASEMVTLLIVEAPSALMSRTPSVGDTEMSLGNGEFDAL